MTETPFPLQFLGPGQMADIDQVLGDPESVHRLLEMGMRVGDQIEMVQPGDPCIVRLGGHKLCIRNGSHFQVLVRMRNVA